MLKKYLQVVGWGRDENGQLVTTEPRLVNMPIVSTETCRSSNPEFLTYTSETTLCAGYYVFFFLNNNYCIYLQIIFSYNVNIDEIIFNFKRKIMENFISAISISIAQKNY